MSDLTATLERITRGGMLPGRRGDDARRFLLRALLARTSGNLADAREFARYARREVEYLTRVHLTARGLLDRPRCQADVDCHTCRGRGTVGWDEAEDTCPMCKGAGDVGRCQAYANSHVGTCYGHTPIGYHDTDAAYREDGCEECPIHVPLRSDARRPAF